MCIPFREYIEKISTTRLSIRSVWCPCGYVTQMLGVSWDRHGEFVLCQAWRSSELHLSSLFPGKHRPQLWAIPVHTTDVPSRQGDAALPSVPSPHALPQPLGQDEGKDESAPPHRPVSLTASSAWCRHHRGLCRALPLLHLWESPTALGMFSEKAFPVITSTLKGQQEAYFLAIHGSLLMVLKFLQISFLA